MDLYIDNESSDSDSEQASELSQKTFVGDEKRHHHNLLERRRRNTLKDNFMSLMEVIPSLVKKGFTVNGKKASRACILRHTIHYLKRAECKREDRLQELRNMKSDLAHLQQYYSDLQNVERTGDFSNVESIFRSIDEVNARVYMYKEDSTDPEEEIEDTGEETDSDQGEEDQELNEGEEDQELNEEEEEQELNEEEKEQEFDNPIVQSIDNYFENASNIVPEIADWDESSEYFFSENE